MSAALNLAVVLTLTDQLSAGLQGISERLTQVGVAGAGMLAAMRVPITAFAEAEDSMTRLKVAMMQAGGVVPKVFADISA
ncbi:hypothetical protein [Candidatus Thiodictyon syntrophicum]|jgi:hypothetical protein|uniref:Phage tail tape measure protein n=1 Tax=Candidatus Thiodictyon syntrophicum TaxID=1166950 RepID=A0A2K8U877_9GAMM|nr:hypothetical protein [Candidatus Thiodictyon syntrophicum]AUB81609.1 hypothetical protein THSYN_11995 [Candidatus Thiodictyon syntrophicum]